MYEYNLFVGSTHFYILPEYGPCDARYKLTVNNVPDGFLVVRFKVRGVCCNQSSQVVDLDSVEIICWRERYSVAYRVKAKLRASSEKSSDGYNYVIPDRWYGKNHINKN